ncbi:hypothetical protein OE88DRAFT_1667182 [Heliocybe sulcata]|uniref:Uncharacterized protein n=1 Tax=Heliocybe sulcata TaxID=5364 RepID=A0A5C3MNM0_9AGAM|nr:hypothetical protein OE88DRAFT_1667182 [Heliocybe sulcata]
MGSLGLLLRPQLPQLSSRPLSCAPSLLHPEANKCASYRLPLAPVLSHLDNRCGSASPHPAAGEYVPGTSLASHASASATDVSTLAYHPTCGSTPSSSHRVRRDIRVTPGYILSAALRGRLLTRVSYEAPTIRWSSSRHVRYGRCSTPVQATDSSAITPSCHLTTAFYFGELVRRAC